MDIEEARRFAEFIDYFMDVFEKAILELMNRAYPDYRWFRTAPGCNITVEKK